MSWHSDDMYVSGELGAIQCEGVRHGLSQGNSHAISAIRIELPSLAVNSQYWYPAFLHTLDRDGMRTTKSVSPMSTPACESSVVTWPR